VNEYVTDTHALIWHEENSPRLSAAAKACFDAADQGRARIYVPSISIVEMTYLGEKGKIPPHIATQTLTLIGNPPASYDLAPLDRSVAECVDRVSRALVPDMPDRIIVATALALGLPLISVDEVITRSGLVTTIW
jgi:PIN domain nuclease of toxin-antitoxin system